VAGHRERLHHVVCRYSCTHDILAGNDGAAFHAKADVFVW
jgi:hypothetical protein